MDIYLKLPSKPTTNCHRKFLKRLCTSNQSKEGNIQMNQSQDGEFEKDQSGFRQYNQSESTTTNSTTDAQISREETRTATIYICFSYLAHALSITSDVIDHVTRFFIIPLSSSTVDDFPAKNWNTMSGSFNGEIKIVQNDPLIKTWRTHERDCAQIYARNQTLKCSQYLVLSASHDYTFANKKHCIHGNSSNSYLHKHCHGNQTLFLSIFLLLLCCGPPLVTCQNEVELAGYGASFPNSVYQGWIASYKRMRSEYIDLDMTYTATGSTTGKKYILGTDSPGPKEPALDYAGSDSPMSDEEFRQDPDLRMFPSVAGAIVIGYNLPELEDLNQELVLSVEILAGIFNGNYTWWNDSVFLDLNPNVTFPRQPIGVVARKDGSGTTQAFTQILDTIPWWPHSFKDRDGWRAGVVDYFGETTRGITGIILSYEYSIGYLSIGAANEAGVKTAKMKNLAGNVVDANITTVQLLMEAAATQLRNRTRYTNSTQLIHMLQDDSGEYSYPIATFTYLIIKLTTMENCADAIELCRYINWFLTSRDAKDITAFMEMVHVSPSLADLIQIEIVEKMECKGQLVFPLVLIDQQNELEKGLDSWHYALIVGCTFTFLILVSVAAYFSHQRFKTNKLLRKKDWEIPIEDIIFYTTSKSTNTGRSRFVMWPSIQSLTDVDEVDDGFQMVQHILQWPGKWNGNTVGLRLLEVKGLEKVKRRTKLMLLFIKDSIIHANILNLLGMAELGGDRYVVSEYCSKGPLSEVLKDEKYNLTNDFKFSLSNDIANGLSFLHSKNVIHGHLRSRNCLIDFKWTVKIADWEYVKIYTHLNNKKDPLAKIRKNPDEIGKDEAAFLQFWTAPEVLKAGYEIMPTTAGDIYSYAIILQEIFTRRDPYSEHYDTTSYSDLLKAVLQNNLRPTHGPDTPTSIRQIMEYGWSEDPLKRPTCDQIQKSLRSAHHFKKTVLDTMMEAVDDYTHSLEEKLEKKSKTLQHVDEKLKYVFERMIPPGMHKKFKHLEEDPEGKEQTQSVCILFLKLHTHYQSAATHSSQKQPQSSGAISSQNTSKVTFVEEGTNIVEQLDFADRKLQEICKKYKAFKIDFCGAYLVLCGIGSKPGREDKHVICAAKIATEILSCDLTKEKGLQWQCAIHKGTVNTALVNNGLPKCYVVGDPIEKVQTLLTYSQPGKTLLSQDYYLNLKLVSDSRFRTLFNSKLKLQGTEEETYWLLLTEGDPGGRPRLTSVDSRASLLSGVSMGIEALASDLEDETSDFEKKAAFRNKNKGSIRTRVLMNPDYNVIRSKLKSLHEQGSVSSSGEQEAMTSPKKSVTSPQKSMTSPQKCMTSPQKSVTSDKMSDGGLNTVTVAEFHRRDSIKSDASEVNIRI